MILHEHPGIAGRGGFRKQSSQAGDEVLTVLRITEERRSFYSSHDDMVKYTGGIDAGFPGHRK